LCNAPLQEAAGTRRGRTAAHHTAERMTENGGVRRITWRLADVARVLTLVVLFMFAWRFFWTVYNAVLMLVLAILIAIVIHAPAKFLSRWMPFRLSFALVVLAFLAGIAGLFVAVIPQIVEQMGQLALQLPAALAAISEWFERTLGSGANGTADLPQRISEQLGEFVGRFVPLAFNLIAVVFGGVAILVLAIFLAAQPEVYRTMVLSMAPPASRERVARIYDEAGASLRLWTIAAAPAVIAAFLISPLTALYVTLFYIVLQQIQSAVTVPLVERRAVNIPAAALLVWQLMLAIGFGFLALFVATPLLAVIVVAVRILYYEPTEEMAARDRRDADARAADARPATAELDAPPAKPRSARGSR
jgi:predicted PurR-regulated permease PerM